MCIKKIAFFNVCNRLEYQYISFIWCYCNFLLLFLVGVGVVFRHYCNFDILSWCYCNFPLEQSFSVLELLVVVVVMQKEIPPFLYLDKVLWVDGIGYWAFCGVAFGRDDVPPPTC